jgi:hypothetical protein
MLILNMILVLTRIAISERKNSEIGVKKVDNHAPRTMCLGISKVTRGFRLWQIYSFVAFESGYQMIKTRTRYLLILVN